MTVRFANHRLGFYIAVFLLSGAVLGLAAYFTNISPETGHDFTIFALVVSALTIFIFMLTLQWSQPRTEVPVVLLLGILWLAMGAWATDVIGPVQCENLAGQRTQTESGSISAQAFCREMKVVQAFSWMLFILFALWFIVMIQLITQAQRFGRWRIWEEPIRELGWFGEMPGYYNQHNAASAYPTGYIPYGYGYGYPMQMQQGQPGQTIIVQPGVNGAPPTVTSVPLSNA